MNMRALNWRRRRTAQRGSMIVTTFVIVLGLTIVLAGVNTLLKEQMRQSLDIKAVALGRLQALYLAEMGVNQFMYDANTNSLVTLPAAATEYDFSNTVAMTRGGVGQAKVRLTPTGGNEYNVETTLTTPDGNFVMPWTIKFAASKPVKHWVLTKYVVSKTP